MAILNNPNNSNSAVLTGGGYIVQGGGSGGGAGGGGGGTWNTASVQTPATGSLRMNGITGAAEVWTGNAWMNVVEVRPSEDELKEGAWTATISQLADLWTVKYGTGWVGESEINDPFYRVAKARLISMSMVEKVQGTHAVVYRIVE